MLEPDGEVLSAGEVEAALTRRTRVVCLTWVHSFSGCVLDLDAVGAVCRERDAWFIVNGSQAVGARPIDVRATPIDAVVSAGFKWLCGPYGTGLCWLRPELFDALRPTKLYWLSALTADDLASDSLDLRAITPRRPGRHDIFGTANFFNSVPLAAAIELLLDHGIERIHEDVDDLVVRILDGVDRSRFRLVRGGSLNTCPARTGPRILRKRSATAERGTHQRRPPSRTHPHLASRVQHRRGRRPRTRRSPQLRCGLRGFARSVRRSS
jgi:selenocysteine lyase/cysteine desulfurase